MRLFPRRRGASIWLIALQLGFAASAAAVPPDRARDLAARLDRASVSGTAGATATPPPGSPATGFDVSGLTLLAHVPVSAFPGSSARANDLWGYVSASGREYAIVGLDRSTGFVEVTNPTVPVIVADIPDANSLTSDVSVYQHYAYNVTDGGPGLQVFDLSAIDDGTVTLLGTAGGGLFGSHNLFINTDSGFAYPCFTNLTAGFVAYDLADPENPQLVGGWTQDQAHDLLVLSYNDCPYAGRTGPCEIAFVFAGGSGLYTVDVTDKSNMVTLSNRTYPNLGYCHQGWMSDDRRYLFIDDEFDELSFGVTTTTYVFDIADVADPVFVTSFTNGLPSTDHNLMVRGNLVFEANYTSGLRVFDVSDVFNVQEVAHLDTFPADNTTGFNGAWTAYPLLPSGVVLVSDMQSGLFIVRMGEPPCTVVTAPQSELPLMPKNRFIAVRPGNPGVVSALRVIPSGLPDAFAAFEGFELWVGDPFEVSEIPSLTDATPPTFTAAELTCTPTFRDWGLLDTVYVFGQAVVPGASYAVQAISQGCFNQGEPAYSPALAVATSRWGDVAGDCESSPCSAPNGSPDVLDLVSILSKFSNVPGTLIKARADLQPGCVDLIIDILDVVRGVNAFVGLPYPFAPSAPDDPCASVCNTIPAGAAATPGLMGEEQ